MLFAAIPGMTLHADAAGYNASAAVAWATNESAHKSVSNLVCSQYVCRCLQAGGLEIPYDTCSQYPNRISTWVTNNGYGTLMDVSDASMNKMKPGDVILVMCSAHESRYAYGIHCIFVTGVNTSAKTFTYSANNAYHHNETMSFSTLKNYAKSSSFSCYTHGTAYNFSTILSMKSTESSSVPSNCKISVSPSKATINDYVQISWSAENATGYTLDIYKDGKKIESDTMKNVTSDMRLYSVGNYVASVTAHNSAGSAKPVKAEFTVTAPSVAVSSVKIDPDLTMKKGDSYSMSATVSPSNATNKTVAWSSSDPNVVTVDKTGNVKAVGAGTATVTAEAGGKKASCKITVADSTPSIPQNNNSNTTTRYSDVPNNTWYTDAVEYVSTKNYMAGTGNGRFEPNRIVTRAMVAQILYAAENRPGVSSGSRFSDVRAGEWYADAINWAAQNNMVAGYGDGRFGPNDSVTREQLVSIMYQYAKKKGFNTSESGDLTRFRDAGQIASYAYNPMCWAVGHNVIGGTDKGIEPKGNATRAQLAVILQSFDRNIRR